MKAVFDPKGGYFKAGGVYMPSLVAELGSIVEDHLKSIGMIHDPEMSPERRALIAEKRAAFENRSKKNPDAPEEPTHGRLPEIAASETITDTVDRASSPPAATMCHKCRAKAVIRRAHVGTHVSNTHIQYRLLLHTTT